MLRLTTLALCSLLLSGCLAASAVSTAAKVTTKVAVGTVKTTAKVTKGAVDLAIPDGEDGDEDVQEEEER